MSSLVLGLVGGMDPTGGAGLLRDQTVARIRGPELEIEAVCTALTQQGSGAPTTYRSADPGRLGEELARLAGLQGLQAVKLGMIPPELASEVGRFLGRLKARSSVEVVFDPVMRASDGGRIGADAGEIRALAAAVDLLTPNAAEYERLGSSPTNNILVKGEQRPNDRIRDRLLVRGRVELEIERSLDVGPDPRGTGCSLATAIACELARGRSIVEAVRQSLAWIEVARRRTRPTPRGQVFMEIDAAR